MPVSPPSDLIATLRAAGCVFAEEEARLLGAAAGSRSELDALVARRVTGVPLEQVVGFVEFAGRRLAIEPGVFVPRRRTELLARLAAEAAPPGGTLVELCCGAGAVAAVAADDPTLSVHAADIDPAAVACARRNLPTGQVYRGDLDAALPAALRGRVDVLVANAPYVPSDEIGLLPAEAREYEPLVALDGGPDGLSVQRRIAAAAPRWLVPGGRLLIETGAHQATGTAAAMSAVGLAISVVTDPELAATVVVGVQPQPAGAA
ncbi:methylase [Actinocatenispora thailandica]|uniref:peptide chain release factor N(5)-glutamine methyltransferase n=1 Tax=Actinocatenispora thailandica TaxID=227318 RepID=A0A7R7DPM8_9ACTN|nr:putative protein N(5)-glutamine methyltransferase [Actinocatenispora thailandica]BCJ35371.1 methylase [Actinocatenispora thailandica]